MAASGRESPQEPNDGGTPLGRTRATPAQRAEYALGPDRSARKRKRAGKRCGPVISGGEGWRRADERARRSLVTGTHRSAELWQHPPNGPNAQSAASIRGFCAIEPLRHPGPEPISRYGTSRRFCDGPCSVASHPPSRVSGTRHQDKPVLPGWQRPTGRVLPDASTESRE